MASKALFAGLHIGIFTLLAQNALNLKSMAAELNVPINRLTILVRALQSLGLIYFEKNLYHNSKCADVFLNKESKLEFIDYLRYQIDLQMYPFLNQLNDAIDGKLDNKSIESYQHWMSDPEQAALYSNAQHSGSLVPGEAIAKLINLSDAESILDIGGGTGAITIKILERFPKLFSTIIDFPNVAEIGWGFITKAGLVDRVRYIPGNALTVQWPTKQDGILMSYLLSGVPGNKISKLFRKAYGCLNEGASVILHDFIIADSNKNTPLPALWQLQHMAFTPEARSITSEWLHKTLTQEGFTIVREVPAIPSLTYLIEAKKINI